MLVANVAAGVAGVMVGLVALAYLSYFVRGLWRGRVYKFPATAVLGLLFGSAFSTAPIGHYLLEQSLWPWFIIGEGLAFVPGALYVVYRFALANPRRR